MLLKVAVLKGFGGVHRLFVSVLEFSSKRLGLRVGMPFGLAFRVQGSGVLLDSGFRAL